jgi:hypothetical protein
MHEANEGGSDNWQAFARRHTDELIDKRKADYERYRLGTRVLWIVLGRGTWCDWSGVDQDFVEMNQ